MPPGRRYHRQDGTDAGLSDDDADARRTSHYGQPEVHTRHMALDTELSLMFFDEDTSFQALREVHVAAFWRIYQLLIPFSQLTLQTQVPQRTSPVCVQKKSADFAVCFASCRAVIHTGCSCGQLRLHQCAFSQFQGFVTKFRRVLLAVAFSGC